MANLTEKTQLYKVYKVMRKTGNKKLIEKNLTEAQAQRLVKSDIENNPNALKSMYCYYKQ